jgi:uncharacterized protein
MPEYLAPGVYVEEVSSGSKPIEGVSTSTAGFLGLAERGPEAPRLVTSWLDFQRWYGGYMYNKSYLAYAVEGFFQNGGQRCFIGRIVPGASVPGASDLVSGSVDTLNVWAIGRGEWGNNIMVKVENASRSPEGQDWFRVHVLYYRNPPDPGSFVDPTDLNQLSNPNRREPDVLETFDNVTEQVGATNNVATLINTSSRLIRVAWSDPENPTRLPNQPFTALQGAASEDPDVTANDFDGDTDFTPGLPTDNAHLLGRGRGLAAFETVDEISLLIIPDAVRDGMDVVAERAMTQCETLKDRFAIVTSEQTDAGNDQLRPPQDTTYAAFYYPWIEIYDPAINDNRLLPPAGHIAGIFARTDVERGVHKAPANEVVRGARNMQLSVTKRNQDMLNPVGVNCIRDFRSDGRGIRLWGARTMSSDPEWKYVNVRRLFIFIAQSIEAGTQWVVFEPNHEPTWAAVVRNVTNFLISVWRSGALMGITQDEAFFVKCDRTTMTQDDIDNGRLICYIGIAPVKPAEFVIFRISQKTLEATG